MAWYSKVRVVVSLLTVLALLVLAGGQSAAYNDRDPQCRWWNTTPMPIYYDWDASLPDPIYTWRQRFVDSLGSWNAQGLKPQFTYSSGSSNRLGAYTELDNRYGKNVLTCYLGYLNQFQAYGNSQYGPDYNWDYYGMRYVTAHELGHGLGLGHSNYWAVMNTYFPTSGPWTPQTDDRDGINAMYP